MLTLNAETVNWQSKNLLLGVAIYMCEGFVKS